MPDAKHRHCTLARYDQGCRCDLCFAARFLVGLAHVSPSEAHYPGHCTCFICTRHHSP